METMTEQFYVESTTGEYLMDGGGWAADREDGRAFEDFEAACKTAEVIAMAGFPVEVIKAGNGVYEDVVYAA